jgi:hypothetical protein
VFLRDLAAGPEKQWNVPTFSHTPGVKVIQQRGHAQNEQGLYRTGNQVGQGLNRLRKKESMEILFLPRDLI